MNAFSPSILVFDSGVGGLSISQEIQKSYPEANICYASDNQAFPYGTKTEAELIARVDKVLHRLQATVQADIIVVACNTASTVVLPHIRKSFSEPIVGVVPAIKPAAAISQSKTIGLLATPGTIAREYTHELIQEYAADCRVVSVGSSELVHLAEAKLKQEPRDFTQALTPILQGFQEEKTIDTLVLACTHFPLLKDEIKALLPHIKYWVDSGEAIARRVGYWMGELSLPDKPEAKLTPNCYFTEETNEVKKLNPALEDFGLGHIGFLGTD